MKKYIAIFSLLSLVFAGSAGATVLNLSNTDDSIVNVKTEKETEFEINHNAASSVNSTLNIRANSGGNTQVAGADMDSSVIDTGDAVVNASEAYDLNGLEVDIMDTCECDGEGDDVINSEKLDDSIVNLESESEYELEVDSQTYDEANLLTNVETDTGNNTQVAGEDMKKDDANTITTGKSDLNFGRSYLANLVLVRFTRN